ncbi:hypothetical protein PENTCL1PPCAC_5915, partial [Pristionchus entomophagus]
LLPTLIAGNPLKRDDLSTNVTMRLLCKGQPYYDGRLRLVVGSKLLDEGRSSSSGIYTVTSSKYSAPYNKVTTKLMSVAKLQIFHTCNAKSCWELAKEHEVPYEYVSTPQLKRPAWDVGRVELNILYEERKVECVNM